MNNKVLIAICLTLLFIVIGVTYLSNAKVKQLKAENAVNELLIDRLADSTTDTVYQTIQINDTIVKPITVERIHTDTVYILQTDGTLIEKPLKVESKIYKDSIINQNDTLSYTLKVTGRSYDDEQYPTLDFIKVNARYAKHFETVIKYQKPKKLVISPQVGVGYGLIHNKPDIYIGIGLTYNLK